MGSSNIPALLPKNMNAKDNMNINRYFLCPSLWFKYSTMYTMMPVASMAVNTAPIINSSIIIAQTVIKPSDVGDKIITGAKMTCHHAMPSKVGSAT